MVPFKSVQPFRRDGRFLIGQPNDCVYIRPLVTLLDYCRADVERPVGRAEHLYHFVDGKAEIHVRPGVILS